jgi:peptide/nickel transport system substrate-binding protein
MDLRHPERRHVSQWQVPYAFPTSLRQSITIAARGSTSPGKAILGNVAEVIADGQNVIFKLRSANADLPAILSDVRMPIMPAGSTGAADTSGVGTGGYVLKAFEPGVKVSVTRNPNYWKAGRAHFDGAEILAINDATARTSALQSGAIDVMHRVSTKTVALLARVRNIEVIEVPSKTHFAAGMMATSPPFDNVDVRLAVKHAINRKALVNATLNGHGTLGNDHPIGPVYKYYAADIPQREYDVDKAKFFLKKAGMTGLKLKFQTSPAISDTAADAAVLMQEQARAAGIDIAITQEPADGYWGNVWGKVPFCAAYYSGRATEAQQLAHAYSPKAPANAVNWNNDRFNELLAQATGTVDDAKRRELFREIQMIVRDDGANVVFQFANLIDACTTKVQHDKVSGLLELDGARAVERWWFG